MQREKRELVYEGTILQVYKDHMNINGNLAEWDYFHAKGGAAIVPILPDGRIVLVKQYRNAVEKYVLELPAGNFDSEGEEGTLCAQRELEEETGYTAENIEWLVKINSLVAFTDEKVEIYVAHGLQQGKQHLDEEEEIEVCVYSVDELKDMIFKGEITDAKTVAGLMAYFIKYNV